MPPRVRSVRPQAPQLRKVEHLGDDLEVPVGLVGYATEFVMEAGDVGLAHVGNLQPADRRQDEAAEVAAVLPRGARFEADRDVLFVEALGKLGDSERPATLLLVARRILSVLDRSEQVESCTPRRFGGQHAMLADAHAAIPRAGPVLDQVVPLPAGQHTDGETAQLVVADDVVLLATSAASTSRFVILGMATALLGLPVFQSRRRTHARLRDHLESRGRVSARVSAKERVQQAAGQASYYR